METEPQENHCIFLQCSCSEHWQVTADTSGVGWKERNPCSMWQSSCSLPGTLTCQYDKGCWGSKPSIQGKCKYEKKKNLLHAYYRHKSAFFSCVKESVDIWNQASSTTFGQVAEHTVLVPWFVTLFVFSIPVHCNAYTISRILTNAQAWYQILWIVLDFG